MSTFDPQEIPWPKPPVPSKPSAPPVDRWFRARNAAKRKGDFTVDPSSEKGQAARDAVYHGRRVKVALAEFYTNFGAWRDSQNGEVRGLALQGAIKAYATLKGLGGDKLFRLQDPG
jgi:hypothetical protein